MYVVTGYQDLVDLRAATRSVICLCVPCNWQEKLSHMASSSWRTGRWGSPALDARGTKCQFQLLAVVGV
jgi:hypothetical protein